VEEIWRDIPGYEGLYQVSNLGNVRSLNYRRSGYAKNLLPRFDGNGYRIVSLSREGKAKNAEIHRLVAIAFIPNPHNLPVVNHKDETRTNDCVDNLEWCTQQYNCTYGSAKARFAVARSKPVEQLKDGVVVKRWESSNAAGRAGFSQTHISKCCNGVPKYKTHKGYEWRYAV
jgi:hypothetical protein